MHNPGSETLDKVERRFQSFLSNDVAVFWRELYTSRVLPYTTIYLTLLIHIYAYLHFDS